MRLWQFKNYQEAQFEFNSQLIIISGPNGSGKTNLLDALHFLSITRSATQRLDADCIHFGQSAFSLTFWVADEQGHKNDKVTIAYQKGDKKQIKVNDINEKAGNYIGRYPMVLIQPDDSFLIHETNETRRNFIDMYLCQCNAAYMEHLSLYKQLLTRRNELLKYFAEKHTFDKQLLDSYSERMLPLARKIYDARQAYFESLQPLLVSQYTALANYNIHQRQVDETPAISYTSQVKAPDFEENFMSNTERDRVMTRTTMGPHRDEVLFLLNDKPLKYFGSQGQQKTFLLAIKLANYELIKQKTGKKPMLLLDDIFDKLDDHRIASLMQLLKEQDWGQIFITDARPERIQKFIATQDYSAQHINLS